MQRLNPGGGADGGTGNNGNLEPLLEMMRGMVYGGAGNTENAAPQSKCPDQNIGE